MNILGWVGVIAAMFAAAGTWTAALGGFIGWLHRKSGEARETLREDFYNRTAELRDDIEKKSAEIKTQNAIDHAQVRAQITEVQVDLREHRVEARAEINKVHERIDELFRTVEFKG